MSRPSPLRRARIVWGGTRASLPSRSDGGKRVDRSRTAGAVMRIAMLGTRGVPARYGGFETCVEEVGSRLVARGHDVVVYCRDLEPGVDRPASHRGMTLVHLPALRRR